MKGNDILLETETHAKKAFHEITKNRPHVSREPKAGWCLKQMFSKYFSWSISSVQNLNISPSTSTYFKVEVCVPLSTNKLNSSEVQFISCFLD